MNATPETIERPEVDEVVAAAQRAPQCGRLGQALRAQALDVRAEHEAAEQEQDLRLFV